MPKKNSPLFFVKWLITAMISSTHVLAMADPLKFCFEDAPQKPWTYPDGTGLNFDLLKRVEGLLKEKFVYSAKPWTRCQEEVKTSQLNGFFATSDSVERRAYSVFPTLSDGKADPSAALYEDHFKVYLRLGGNGSWDGKILNNAKRDVIVQRGYFVASVLRVQGFKTNETAKTAEEGLRLLAAGAAEVAVLQGDEAEDLVKRDSRFKGIILITPTPYAVLQMYLAIDQKTYQENPTRIKAIWDAIRVIRGSAEYKKLLELNAVASKK
jgi:polar amino acid transport system substrate-binding protein